MGNTFWGQFQSALQVTSLLLTGLASIITPFAPIIIEYIRNRKGKTEAPASDVQTEPRKPAPVIATVVKTPTASRSLLELSVVLICAGILSAILSDSMVVSGRSPTLA